jgi:lambda repressor-like predicted transcriptional regulator
VKSRLTRLTEKKDRAVAEWEDEIRAELAAGRSLREVARDAGVSYETIRRIRAS